MNDVRTYSAGEAAKLMGCTERWLLEQLRSERFQGCKIGRHWRLTEQDIEKNLDVCRTSVRSMVPAADTPDGAAQFASLTVTSRRKLAPAVESARNGNSTHSRARHA